MSRSRMCLYFFIALAVALFFYYTLADEPHPEWPVNIIHLLRKH